MPWSRSTLTLLWQASWLKSQIQGVLWLAV
jgi:hypothetical protein